MAEMSYTSRGVGNAGLTTGIIGTALGVLNGGLGNILGGWGANNAYCHENMPVNRYEQALQSRIANLETEVKLRDANAYTISQIDGLRTYVDGRITNIEKEICEQHVYNTANTATINCLAGQVAQLMSLTKMVIPITNVCPQPAVATTTT
jgi:hypothetical protein